MLAVREIIKEHQRRLARISFLERLESAAADPEHGKRFAQDLTFWVMTFQDALRLNRAHIKDPALRSIADHHLREDSGHEKWFWHDAHALSAIQAPEWYFGNDAAHVRELSFEIVSEVFRAQHDESRITLILTLEATGEEFFPRVVSYFQRCGWEAKLKYFAQTHRNVERDHEVFEVETEAQLAKIQLTPAQRAESLSVVARIFSAFERLGGFLERRITDLASENEQTTAAAFIRCAAVNGLNVRLGAAAESFGIDFGGIERSPISGVVDAQSEADVERALGLANQLRTPLSIRAGGHSQAGQSLPVSGLSLYIGSLRDLQIDTTGETATCGPGATWRQIIEQSLESHLVPIVMPLNLDLTVGGTLAASGLGSNSHRYGSSAHHVTELTMVSGGAQNLSGTRSTRPELFDAMLGNQGRCGVATRITLKLRRACPRVQTIAFKYGDLADLLHDMTWLSEHAAPDHMEAFVSTSVFGLRRTGDSYSPLKRTAFALHLSYETENELDPSSISQSLRSAELLVNESNSIASYLGRYDVRLKFMKASGAWNQAHPWLEWLLPGDRAIELASFALNQLPPSFGDGHRLFALAPANYPKFFAMPKAKSIVGLAVLPTGIASEQLPSALKAAGAIDRELMERGARRYLSGWLETPDATYWQRHHGDQYEPWVAAKQLWDPNAILQSVLFERQRA